MTIETQNNKTSVFDCDGIQTDFPFTNLPLDNANDDLEVFIINADGTQDKQTINVDYTLTYSRDTNSGTITYLTAPESDKQTFGIRVTELTQTFDIPLADDFDARRTEDALDKLQMQVIDSSEAIDRSVKFGPDFTGNVTVYGNRMAGSALVVNETLDGITYSTTNVNDIDQAVTDAQTAATNAQTSAANASTSESNASNSASAAATSAQEAEDSASSIDLPDTPVALTYLRRNAGNTEYEARTPEQVREDTGSEAKRFKSIFTDEKASTVQGGTFTSGTQTRVLNTVKLNDISGASLSSNQITLPAGTYDILAFCPAQQVNQHKARLYNFTDSLDEIIGKPGRAPTTAEVQTESIVSGRFTITDTKVFEIRHWGTTTRSSNGFGSSANDGTVNTYTHVTIEKVG